MPTFRVLIPWTNEQGTHSPDDTVELPTESAAEQSEVDRLINYGILEPGSTKDAPAPVKHRTRKADAGD
jgi:hypothetical protein